MDNVDVRENDQVLVRPRRRRWPWLLLALAVLVAGIPAFIWFRGEIVDGSACDGGGRHWDGRTPVGMTSWVSMNLPIAKVDGVRVTSYRVLGSGLEDEHVVIKLVDRERYLDGQPSGLSLAGGSYGDQLEGYLPGITRFFRGPVGASVPVREGITQGLHPNLALFVGATRSDALYTVSGVKVTFRSGLRSQTCDVGIHFTIGPGAEESL